MEPSAAVALDVVKSDRDVLGWLVGSRKDRYTRQASMVRRRLTLQDSVNLVILCEYESMEAVSEYTQKHEGTEQERRSCTMLLARRAFVSSAKPPIEPFTSMAFLQGEAATEEIFVDVAEEEELAKELLERRTKQ